MIEATDANSRKILMEMWNRHGERFPKVRGGDEIKALLEGRLPPGTFVEGEWLRKKGVLYLFDYTYRGINPNNLAAKAFTSQEAEAKVMSEKLSSIVKYTETEENSETLKEFEANQQLSRIRCTDKINYHYPPAPKEGSEEILRLPPDDWVMEMKLNGDRVLAFEQPNEHCTSVDMRMVSYAARRQMLENLVMYLNVPEIQVMPVVKENFPMWYDRWKNDLPGMEVEGVVVKRRNSPYESGTRNNPRSKNWQKRRFVWDSGKR